MLVQGAVQSPFRPGVPPGRQVKHAPQCAARKLSAVSFQHSAFERHENRRFLQGK